MPESPKSLIDIDENALDQEWLRQPSLMLEFSEEKAQAQHEYDMHKAAFELVGAKLTFDVKADWKSYGFLKDPSVDAVEARVITCPEYQDAQRKMLQAKLALDNHSAAVSACDHRKKALENLVQLQFMGYHSEPKARSAEDRQRFTELSKKTVREPVRG